MSAGSRSRRRRPAVVHTFCPLITHSSPSSTAVVFRLARSDPESGSEKPWHQRTSPPRIFGRNSCFCSSLPHCRIVGPTSVSPKKSARSGAFTRANSSASTTPCSVDRPLPPYSTGQVAQIQPPANSFAGQRSLNSLRSLGDELERLAPLGGLDPAGGEVVGQPLADLGAERLGVGVIAQLHCRHCCRGTVTAATGAQWLGCGTWCWRARLTRWTAQWKELFEEVITTGLCTGCAGCVVTCPHDVIGYEHEEGKYIPFHLEDELGPANCIHGEKGCTTCTRACPRFRAWEPSSRPPPVRPGARPDEMAGIWQQLLLTRANDELQHVTARTVASCRRC